MRTGIEQCSGILQDRLEGGTNERRERVVLQLLDMPHRQFPPNVHLGKPQGVERVGLHSGPGFGPGDEENDVADRIEFDVERRSEEHTSELQSLMRISYAVFCLKKK